MLSESLFGSFSSEKEQFHTVTKHESKTSETNVKKNSFGRFTNAQDIPINRTFALIYRMPSLSFENGRGSFPVVDE
jgi:hypothetical protein